MILLATVGAMILFGIIAMISILVGLNASSLNPQETAVPRIYSDDWYGPNYNYAFQPEGVENATKYFVTAFDEDFNNTSRSYYQAAGIDGWSVLYSDDSDAPYRYNISRSFKYDRWVKYEGNECYHINDTWICAVLLENSYSDDWYGPDYNYAFQPEGVENATKYFVTAFDEDFNSTSRSYYKVAGIDGWSVLYSDDSDAPYRYNISGSFKYDRWVKYEGNECYHINDTWICAVLLENSYSDDWYGPDYNYAFQPEGVENATKYFVTAFDEDFNSTSRSYYKVAGIDGWSVLYSDESDAPYRYNISGSFKYDRWVKYEGNECYHINDTWICAIIEEISYSDDWYGPDYNYAFQPVGVENATKYFVTAFDEDFNSTSRSYYKVAGIDGWSVLYSDESDAPYRYNISGSFKYDRWVKYEGNECYHIVDTWICAILE